jgi:hypothetical protein
MAIAFDVKVVDVAEEFARRVVVVVAAGGGREFENDDNFVVDVLGSSRLVSAKQFRILFFSCKGRRLLEEEPCSKDESNTTNGCP